MKKIYLLGQVSLLLIVALPSFGQKKVSHQQQMWLRYAGRYNLSKSWSIRLEVEDRRFAFPDRQQVWLLPRVTVNRKLGDNWSAGAGFLYYINNSPADPKSDVTLHVPELRPFQELSYKQSIHKLTLSHRYWLEERFSRKNDGSHLEPGYRFNFRFRYQLGAQYPLTKSGNLALRAFDEIFLNFGHSIVRNTFDQNRISAGLLYTFSKQAQIEADYMNQFQQKSSGDNYVRTQILRVTFFHTLNFY
jgi:hypothetical protein